MTVNTYFASNSRTDRAMLDNVDNDPRGSLSTSEQFAGVRQRGLADLAGQHAGDFEDACVAYDLFDLRFDTRFTFDAPRHEMHLPAHGNLREMRDDDDLVRLRKLRDFLGQRHGDGTAHASIHLVEDQRVDVIVRAEHHLAGEHDAADFAT